MEVEAKFIYKEGVEEKLREIAEPVIEKFEHDTYFNHPCKDFEKTDEAVRIRRDVEGVAITYKGPKVDLETKSREEVKVKVDSFEDALDLLRKLGFRPVMEVRKFRKIYRLKGAIVCIDEVEGVGKFVEIEIESGSIRDKETIFDVAKLLGYSREESITRSYLEMILQKK